MSHQIDVEVGGKTIERWKRYSITTDLLAPADDFDLEIGPLDKEIFDLLHPDAEVVVRVDGTTILTGYIDERRVTSSKASTGIGITGRDKGGRLVDESMPLQTFGGLQTLDQLVEATVSPWFTSVIFDNSDNRTRLRGKRGRKANAYGEPVVLFDRKKAPKKVEPGDARWDVLMSWLEPSELLAWSTADGSAFVVGLPNYDQETQYSFRAPAPGSEKRGNVLDYELVDSIAERYSQITIVGASKGDSSNYGRGVTKHRGIAANSIGVDGIGDEFERRKTLIISDDDVKSAKDAEDRALRQMAIRDASARTLRITVDGHGQQYDRSTPPTLYAIDTMAQVEIEELEISERYLLVSVQFSVDRAGGEITTISLVPEHTVLTQ